MGKVLRRATFGILLASSSCQRPGPSADTVAMVGEVQIARATLQQRLEAKLAKIAGPNVISRALKVAVQEEALEELIDEEVIRQEAARLHISIAESDLELAISRRLDLLGIAESDESPAQLAEVRAATAASLLRESVISHQLSEFAKIPRDMRVGATPIQQETASGRVEESNADVSPIKQLRRDHLVRLFPAVR